MKYSTAGHILYVRRKLTVCIVIWRKSRQLVNVSIQYHFTLRILPVVQSSRTTCTVLDCIRPQMYSLYIQDEVLYIPLPLNLWLVGSEDEKDLLGRPTHSVSSAKSLITRAHPSTSFYSWYLFQSDRLFTNVEWKSHFKEIVWKI